MMYSRKTGGGGACAGDTAVPGLGAEWANTVPISHRGARPARDRALQGRRLFGDIVTKQRRRRGSPNLGDRLGRWPGCGRAPASGAADGAKIGDGRPRGVLSRSPTGYGSTSPDDESMRISHKAIYQALYVQGRGALRRELTACLRTGRALRVPRARTRRRGKTFVHPEIMLSERPAEADDRAVPGHWEGDLILGLGSSAIGTLVERTGVAPL